MKDEGGKEERISPISYFILHNSYLPIGASPSGKAPPFGGGIRRFESSRPSYFGKIMKYEL
jgi:hypothetical protein